MPTEAGCRPRRRRVALAANRLRKGSEMVKRLAIALVSMIVASAATAQDRSGTPGNPPRILIASSIDADGNLELVTYRTIYIGFGGYSYNARSLQKVPLKDVRIRTVAAADVSVDEARKLLEGKETPILVSSWSEPLSEFYRGLFSGKSLLFIFPRDAPLWKQIQEPSRPVR
jgi:hypothetical protein